MRILVDMNLSPTLCGVLKAAGFDAIHFGDPRASDAALMTWASTNDYLVVTHDLDFGAILSATHATGPSVIQVRTQDVMPEHLGPILIGVLQRRAQALESGALVVVDEARARVRVLPL